MRSAIVSGSFDPMTNGHMWIVQEALKMVDVVHLVIASNATKQHMFSPGERYRHAADVFGVDGRVNVRVLPPGMLLVNYARELNCKLIIRGLRNTTDFEYEGNINLVQRKVNPDLQTVYLLSEQTEVSSSLVRSLVGLQGWELVVADYVPTPVFQALRAKVK